MKLARFKCRYGGESATGAKRLWGVRCAARRGVRAARREASK
jgi:hypothetical protein